MDLKQKVKQAISEIQKVFPFHDYIGMSVYYEMYAIMKQLTKFIPEYKDKKLVDIGCGPMDKTGIFQTLGFQCYAADDLSDPWHLRNNNIEKICRYAEEIGINFYLQKAGDHTIPFEEETFDIVCALALIEHLHESPRGLMNTMGKFLKTDGLLVIVMPNSVNLRKRLSVLMGSTNHSPVDQFYYSLGTWRGHVREYTLKEMIYICEESGFEVLSKSTFESLATRRLKPPLSQLYSFFGNIIPTLRSRLLVICSKPKSWTPVPEDATAFRKAISKSVPKGVS